MSLYLLIQLLSLPAYLADLVEDLLLQYLVQELQLIVAPEFGQIESLVLDDHAQFLAVTGAQLLNLLEAIFAAHLVVELLEQFCRDLTIQFLLAAVVVVKVLWIPQTLLATKRIDYKAKHLAILR